MDEKERILIVEGDESACKTLSFILNKEGYETETAGTGREAIKKAKRGNFNLILLDIELPDVEGLELIAPMKEMHSDITVIMITTLVSVDKAMLASNKGATAFITKPVDKDRVLVIVKGAMENQRQIEAKRLAAEKTDHLNLVFQAIRRVNQLIAEEEERDLLLKRICEDLNDNRTYFSAWIAAMDEAGNLVASFESGVGENFAQMVDKLKLGEMTTCMQRALAQPDAAATENPPSECADCPLAKDYSSRGALTVRLERGARLFGLMTVSIPAQLTAEEEEHILLQQISRDITLALYSIEQEEKRKRAEETLRESEEKYRYLVENLMDGIAIVDLGERFVFTNPAVEDLFGNPEGGLTGRSLQDFMSEEEFEKIKRQTGERLLHKKSIYEITIIHPNGEERQLLVSATPKLNAAGKVEGTLGIFRDKTDYNLNLTKQFTTNYYYST